MKLAVHSRSYWALLGGFIQLSQYMVIGIIVRSIGKEFVDKCFDNKYNGQRASELYTAS